MPAPLVLPAPSPPAPTTTQGSTFTIICVLNHERISWVSIEIYYHDNFVFGHIFMFLTSFYDHFCVLCAQLVG